MNLALPPRVLKFGAFELDLGRAELRKGGVRVRLNGKPFDALTLLVERSGSVVRREELREHLWGRDAFGDFEDSLNHAIGRVREALGDDSKHPRFIETVPGVGYRFVVHVERQTAAQSATALGATRARPWWPTAAALALVCLVGFISWLAWPRPPTKAGFEKLVEAANPSIAVLPFANISGQQDNEIFGVGIADALINELAKIGSLRVISRTSTLRYREHTHTMTLPQIAAELGATHVIEGSVLRDEGQLKITVQLIEADSDEHLWAKSYDESPGAVIPVQSRVAEEIAREIQVELTPEEETRLAAARPVNQLVYGAYVEARSAHEEGRFLEAMGLFQKTIELDADYAPAHAWLAESITRYFWWTKNPADVLREARSAAQQSLELNDTLAEPHLILGQTAAFFEWRWEAAEQHYLRAIELNPSYTRAYRGYADYLLLVGRPEEAIQAAEQALALDPLSAQTVGTAGLIYHGAGLKERGTELFRSALEMSGGGLFWQVEMGCAYTSAGRYQEAIDLLEPISNPLLPDMRAKVLLAWAHARAGNHERLAQLKQELDREIEGSHSTRYFLSALHAAEGDMDTAFSMLDQAVDERWPYLGTVAYLPPFEELRAEPRFADFLGRIGLKDIRERNARSNN